MVMAGRLEDARERLAAAESRLKELDYAGALYEAERCIELSVKGLLDRLGVNYQTKEGRIPHDVGDKISEAFEKLKSYLKDYDARSSRVELARAAVLLRSLASIREYLEFGVHNLSGSKETFDSVFAGDLAKVVVSLAHRSYYRISDLANKIK